MIQTSSGYYAGGIMIGADPIHYPIVGGFVYNLFDTASSNWIDNITPNTTNGNFTVGSSPNFSKYTVSRLGNYQFKAFFDVTSFISSSVSSGSYTFSMIKNNTDTLYSSTNTHLGSTNIFKYIQFDASTATVSMNTGDYIDFRLQLSNFNTSNFTASISSGSTYSFPVVVNDDTLYTVSSIGFPFISGSVDTDSSGLNDTLILSEKLTSLISTSIYHPEYASGSITSSSLYTKYGDVDYTFNIIKGDLVLFKSLIPALGIVQYEYHVEDFYLQGNKYYVKLSSDLPSALSLPVYTTSSFEEVLFLREFPDETLMLLDFKKKSGATSYGFTVPSNLHPDVLKNISTITQEVKTKLIEINQTP